ncbi:LysE family translocator [Desulfobotulus sp.]|jgi:threonine/homoserine/homoserine lactone efflux protein|uniref:LysE family translocator n=1 Tax=Desulfobotulus sp. TaxID=1940337 RepID=UPI002A3614F3|nr:LysE family translocator [Desulfobotulus sp.]MDY0164094.1 LysE family translocator [Desulfobotulus sp.]
MFDASLLTFLLAMLVLTLAPGADTLLVVRNTLRGGWREGDITSLGICFGLFMHAGLSAAGISLILLRSATAFSLLKTLGALYLIWLGIKSLRAAMGKPPALSALPPQGSEPPVPKSVGRAFTEGFLSNILNPKTAVFYMAFLPQFIRPQDPIFLKSMFLAALHFMMALFWLCLVAHSLHRLRGLFHKPTFTRWLEGASGGLLLGFGIRLGLTKAMG